jgi:hypothetical protein
MTQIKCLKDVYTDNSQYLMFCDEDEIEEALSFPIKRLFTKDASYEVKISGEEWRVHDDTSTKNDNTHNHIVFNANDSEHKWFFEHFEII